MNDIKNFKPVRLWAFANKVFKIIKYPFIVVTIGLFSAIWWDLPKWLGYSILVFYLLCFLMVAIGAIGARLNDMKIKGICDKLDITITQWNNIIDSLK